jgi:hypothetical protein
MPSGIDNWQEAVSTQIQHCRDKFLTKYMNNLKRLARARMKNFHASSLSYKIYQDPITSLLVFYSLSLSHETPYGSTLNAWSRTVNFCCVYKSVPIINVVKTTMCSLFNGLERVLLPIYVN